MNDTARTTYRVIQKGPSANIPATDFESLVTHHPGDNRNAHMEDGVIVDGERGRLHAYVGGEIQEVEIARRGNAYGLKPDQVLLKKDFVLEHPDHPTMSAAARRVDVPSPISGYVGRVDAAQGLVDIYDQKGGDVIARARHMRGIAVTEGQSIEYGQSLGTQSDAKTGAKHVHLEMDTRYYQQYANYVSDLVGGRLPVEAAQRAGVQALPVMDDGIIRLGESSERVKDLQRVMANEGYRAAGDKPLDQDGVYRIGMQGSLLDFQRAHGLPQTGDIDPATLRFAPTQRQDREVDRVDHTAPGQTIPMDVESVAPRAPGHPDHSDHRIGLPDPLSPAVNRPAPARSSPAERHHPDHALLERIRDGVRELDQQAGKPWDERSERLSASLLVLAGEKGFTANEDVRVAFNQPTSTLRAGEFVHVFRIASHSPDPAANRAHMTTAQALAAPTEESYRQLDALRQSQAGAPHVTRQQDLQRDPTSPHMSMKLA